MAGGLEFLANCTAPALYSPWLPLAQ